MNSISPFASKPQKKKRFRQPQNFAEALKSIGGHSQDHLRNNPSGSIDLSKTSSSNISSGTESSEVLFKGEQLSKEVLQEQELIDKQRHLARHKEVTSTPVYDRREEAVKKQIESLRNELKALASELAAISLSIQKAIEEEISHPGTYHVNFFEKLRFLIVTIRKKANDSQSWLDISMQRKASKNVYWGNVKKSGTKYMLSSERNMVTNVG